MHGRCRSTPWSHWASLRVGVRFARAVPRREDRSELRRALRIAARETARDHKREVTALLRALAASRVPVIAVRCRSTGDTIVEFRDGTVLTLVVREGEVRLQRFARRIAPVVYLGSVEPCYGHLWFRLTFVAMFDHISVMAQVGYLPGAPTPGWAKGRGEEAGPAEV